MTTKINSDNNRDMVMQEILGEFMERIIERQITDSEIMAMLACIMRPLYVHGAFDAIVNKIREIYKEEKF